MEIIPIIITITTITPFKKKTMLITDPVSDIYLIIIIIINIIIIYIIIIFYLSYYKGTIN